MVQIAPELSGGFDERVLGQDPATGFWRLRWVRNGETVYSLTVDNLTMIEGFCGPCLLWRGVIVKPASAGGNVCPECGGVMHGKECTCGQVPHAPWCAAAIEASEETEK